MASVPLKFKKENLRPDYDAIQFLTTKSHPGQRWTESDRLNVTTKDVFIQQHDVTNASIMGSVQVL